MVSPYARGGSKVGFHVGEVVLAQWDVGTATAYYPAKVVGVVAGNPKVRVVFDGDEPDRVAEVSQLKIVRELDVEVDARPDLDADEIFGALDAAMLDEESDDESGDDDDDEMDAVAAAAPVDALLPPAPSPDEGDATRADPRTHKVAARADLVAGVPPSPEKAAPAPKRPRARAKAPAPAGTKKKTPAAAPKATGTKKKSGSKKKEPAKVVSKKDTRGGGSRAKRA